MSAPEPGQAWGILGGVFDPVHLGHLKLAKDVIAARQLSGVLLIPAFQPPHRTSEPRATFEQRLAMLELAVVEEPNLMVSRIEETTTPPSYTLNTLRALRAEYSGTEFNFIIGADNVSLLKTWHRWETVLEEVRLLVGHRPGANLDDLKNLPGERIDLVETTPLDISSTAIRTQLGRGVSRVKLETLVPVKVAEYILEKRLYV